MPLKKKKIDWENIRNWIIVFIVIIALIFIIDYFMPESNYPGKCKQECSKFDMGFYKTERDYGGRVICWCLDNGKPKSIGGIT